MRHFSLRFTPAIILATLLCVGCTTQEKPSNVKAHTKTTRQKVTTTVEFAPKENGDIISMKKVKIDGANSGIETYRMMYWSEGTKTESYVAIPKGPGTFALWVDCHGGWTTKENRTHVSAWDNGPDNVTQDETLISNAGYSWVTLVPMYRGYGNSEGTVNGLDGDTIDTQNAITAVKNIFKTIKGDRHLQDNEIHLTGGSMGGGVALKVASERDDVLSVVVTSPFVGWDIVGSFDGKHLDNPTLASYYNNAVKEYGPFDPESAVYQKESISYQNIKAPTLLIQGNSDQYTPWQTVETFYNKMKANGQDVTFKLIDGGLHNLTNKTDIMNDILNKWYSGPEHY